MHAEDFRSTPAGWLAISREEALHLCAFRKVVVAQTAFGSVAVSEFGPDSPFYSAHRPYDYRSLRYFVAIGSVARKTSRGGGSRPKPAQPTDLPREPEVQEAQVEETKRIPEIRIVKLDADQFAPLVEAIQISYAIDGELAQAESAYLRVASQAKPGALLLDRKLDGALQARGVFQWDGAVTDGGYPGCLNLAGSPYWVQLGLAGKGGKPRFTNKVALHVELVQTELSVGDPFGLGEEDERKNAEMLVLLREELKKTPDEGRVHLPGSFFKVDLKEMNDQSSYTVYGDRLREGLAIPLFVKLWVKAKDGTRKRAPQAVTGTRILWDAVPDDEAGLDDNLSDRDVHAEAKKFMKGVSAYKHDKTEPKGYTAHWELGGIRAVKQARKWGRQQWESLDDGWKGDALAQRYWAGRSVCGKIGTAASDSGMIYFNGRIAGDRYHVTAYADLDGSLDDVDPGLGKLVLAERKTKTLALRNWRNVHVSASYKIGASTTPLAFDGANQEFKKAAMSIVPKPGLVHEDIQIQWKSSYKDAVIIFSGLSFIRDAAMDDPGLYPVRFISHNEYWEKTNADAGFFGKIWHRIKAFFGAADEEAYVKKCNDHAYPIYEATVQSIPLGKNGLTCIKFGERGDHNRWKKSYTAGIAPSIRGYSTRTKAILLIFEPGHADHTVIHEMGHNLFLPHAPGHWDPAQNPDGFKPLLHDRGQICIMSYHPDAKYFCALCLLRMSGWDHGSIKNDGTVIDLFDAE